MANKLEEARKSINRIDAQMAELFVERMRAAEMVYEHKKEYGLPILDTAREQAVIQQNVAGIADEELKGYYIDFLKNVMAVSRAYQYRMQEGLNVVDDIVVERGILASAQNHLDLNRRVLVVTDSGVPAEYAETIAAQCKDSVVCTVEMGEGSKSLKSFEKLLQVMLDNDFSRKDCVVAVGGGVVGDLAGFVASAYMRGVDFYNIPTTLLSQIDSSIGGKTAVNFGGVKNVIGAFYQPKKVLIDPDLLKTLPDRQIANGLAEAIKMALTSDPELFAIFENEDVSSHLDEIIIRSLNIKKHVVEQDEKEAGLRKILNFGHTIGHGIESCVGDLYHGECVALGMIPMCGEDIRERVIAVLKKCHLYQELAYDWDKIAKAMFHDKKADGHTVTAILVNTVGNFEIATMDCTAVLERAKRCLKG